LAAFISKISIVIEEADKTEFWLEFIMEEKNIGVNLKKYFFINQQS